jgi:hypothetical protein
MERLCEALNKSFRAYADDFKTSMARVGEEFKERNPNLFRALEEFDHGCDADYEENLMPFGFLEVEERGLSGRKIEFHVSEVQAYMDHELVVKGKDKPLVVVHDKYTLREKVTKAQMDWARFELFKAGKLYVKADDVIGGEG